MKIRFPSLVKSGKNNSSNVDKSTTSNSSSNEDESDASSSLRQCNNNKFSQYRSSARGRIETAAAITTPESPLGRLKRRGISPLSRRSMSPIGTRRKIFQHKTYPSLLNTGTKGNRFYHRQQNQEQEQQQEQQQEKEKSPPSANSSGSSDSASSVDSAILYAKDGNVVAGSLSSDRSVHTNILKDNSSLLSNNDINTYKQSLETDANNSGSSSSITCDNKGITSYILTKDFEKYFKNMIQSNEDLIGNYAIENSETVVKNSEGENGLVPTMSVKKEAVVENKINDEAQHGSSRSHWVLNQRYVLSDTGEKSVKTKGQKLVHSPSLKDGPFTDDSDDSCSSCSNDDDKSCSSGSSRSHKSDDDHHHDITMIDSNHIDMKNPPIGSLTIIDADHRPGEYKKSRKKRNYKTRKGGYDDDDDDDELEDGNSEGERTLAQGLALKLIRDLESVRQENERYALRNRRLRSQIHELKAQQDEYMVHRSRLLKACIYTSPVFVLCGGLDAFLTTILLVWVLVEVDSYMDLGDDDGVGEDFDDDDDDDIDDEDDLLDDDLDDYDLGSSNDDEDEDVSDDESSM